MSRTSSRAEVSESEEGEGSEGELEYDKRLLTGASRQITVVAEVKEETCALGVYYSLLDW